MADMTTKTFTQLVQGIAAAIQARAAGLVDFTVGSIARASSEAFAGVVLWLEGLILTLLTATRAQTSVGADLDSWVADFGAGPTSQDPTLIERLPASGASGSVTFSRLSTTGQAVVPVSAAVATLDGSQPYLVTLDTANPAYSAPLGGYVMAAGIGSVTVSVQAVNTGAATNAVAGAVNTITSAIPGVDAVTNAAGFTNGTDAETDPAFLARFRSFLGSLRKATPAALAYAINSLQVGIQCQITEGLDYAGTTHKGFFYFVVDDGSRGSAPAGILNAIGTAVDADRAAGIEFAIYAAVAVVVNVGMTVTVASTADPAATKAAVSAAVAAYLTSVPLGAGSVPMSRVYQVAHDASPDVVEITNLTLNGGTADIAVTNKQVVKAGTMTVV